MVTVIFIIAFVLLILGLLGSIIPGLPGPPLSFIGILLIHFFTGTQFSTSFYCHGQLLLFWCFY